MPQFIAGLCAGLLIGIIIEWAVDWKIWRRPVLVISARKPGRSAASQSVESETIGDQ